LGHGKLRILNQWIWGTPVPRKLIIIAAAAAGLLVIVGGRGGGYDDKSRGL
jgi:hypothetical protein